MTILWLTFLGLCLNLSSFTSALFVPQHNCEGYFDYFEEDIGGYFGVFTAPRSGVSSLSWTVSFSAHGYDEDTVSPLMPYPSKALAFEKIHNGERGTVFVRFQDFGNELPKLTYAEVNGEVLCEDNEYKAPSITLTRTLLMSTSAPNSQSTAPSKHLVPPPPPPPKPSTTLNDNPFSRRSAPRIESDFDQCGEEGFGPLQIGGELVTRGQYPWLAALYDDRSFEKYTCVTSVISKRTVITAAHCIHGKSPSQLWVYLGRHDRNENPESGALLVSVNRVLTPSEFEGDIVPDKDVGLLVLDEPIVYTKYIKPLCLWSKDLRVSPDEGETGMVAGWGYDQTGEKTRFPMTVNVRLVPLAQCLKEMKRAEDFLTSRTICAGNSQAHGPCFGDSGSALVVLRNNRYYVRGIVSISPRQGFTCDLSGYVIYCDVAKHIDWVRQNMVV
uniref:Serine protease gd-like n=1 Tax=Drosophila rhopaloa TaxID=1041015 RepID=A0A6P4F0J4_DRORH